MWRCPHCNQENANGFASECREDKGKQFDAHSKLASDRLKTSLAHVGTSFEVPVMPAETEKGEEFDGCSKNAAHQSFKRQSRLAKATHAHQAANAEKTSQEAEMAACFHPEEFEQRKNSLARRGESLQEYKELPQNASFAKLSSLKVQNKPKGVSDNLCLQQRESASTPGKSSGRCAPVTTWGSALVIEPPIDYAAENEDTSSVFAEADTHLKLHVEVLECSNGGLTQTLLHPAADMPGYVGLRLSQVAPYKVVLVKNVMDSNYVKQGMPGYSNEKISPGDRLITVNGRECITTNLDGIHKMLKGFAHTEVVLTLVRADGSVYTCRVIRHPAETQLQAGTAPRRHTLTTSNASFASAASQSSQVTQADCGRAERFMSAKLPLATRACPTTQAALASASSNARLELAGQARAVQAADFNVLKTSTEQGLLYMIVGGKSANSSATSLPAPHDGVGRAVKTGGGSADVVMAMKESGIKQNHAAAGIGVLFGWSSFSSSQIPHTVANAQVIQPFGDMDIQVEAAARLQPTTPSGTPFPHTTHQETGIKREVNPPVPAFCSASGLGFLFGQSAFSASTASLTHAAGAPLTAPSQTPSPSRRFYDQDATESEVHTTCNPMEVSGRAPDATLRERGGNATPLEPVVAEWISDLRFATTQVKEAFEKESIDAKSLAVMSHEQLAALGVDTVSAHVTPVCGLPCCTIDSCVSSHHCWVCVW